MTEALPNSQIKDLLASPEPPFKHIGLEHLVLGWPGTARLALEHIVDCDRADLEIIGQRLPQRAPFLRKTFGPPRGLGRRSYRYFGELQRELTSFLAALREVMAGVPAGRRDEYSRRLAGFFGVAQEVRALAAELWSERESDFFKACSDRALTSVKRQFMIFLLYHCNLRCPYCFAGGQSSAVLPFSRVIALLDWMQANRAEEVMFCGGEPTLYPDFVKVLDAVAERGWKTYFPTNLLGPDHVIARFKPDLIKALIVHVAPRETYSPDQWARFLVNLKRVRDQGVSQGLRINLYQRDCDFEHVLGIIREIGIKEVQFALAFPSVGRDNLFIGVDQFQEFVAPVMELKQAFEREGARFIFSKPLPLCLFPEGERMILRSEFPPSCSACDDEFTHNACVSPDENVSPCLALLDVTRPFSTLRDWNDLRAFCRGEIFPLLDLPLFDHCPDCFLFERRLCQGACLALKKFKPTG